MSIFQNDVIKKNYLKSKLIVKKWEDEFTEKNGRIPTRKDIKLSPAVVRESYNTYYKIKTEFLASQILDTHENKCKNLNHSFDETSDLVAKGSKSSNECNIETNETVIKDVSKLEKIDPKTWGFNFNRNKINKVSLKRNTSLNSFSEKLFQGSTFNKRNPRKTLSVNKKITSTNVSNLSESRESEENKNLHLNQNSNLLESNLNKNPVGLNNELHFNIKDNNEQKRNIPSILIVGKNTLLKPATDVMQNVNVIQAISSDPYASLKSMQGVEESWVQRCIQSHVGKKVQRNSDPGLDSVEDSTPILDKNKYLKDSSDDDFICSSDDECEDKKRPILLPARYKRKANDLDSNSKEEILNSKESDTLFQDNNISQVHKKIKLSSEKPNNNYRTRDIKVKSALLEKKIKAGTLNENYVKINLERKTYVRGKKKFNFSKYKKQKWKMEKKNCRNLYERNTDTKYGEIDFSENFRKLEDNSLVGYNKNEDYENILLTINEAEKLAKVRVENDQSKIENSIPIPKPNIRTFTFAKVDPYYETNENGFVIESPPELHEILQKFGFSQFYPEQEKAVMRILSGLSTLLIIPTGRGKSLCYQLPAYMYASRKKYITIVISPLVSLMEDQVSASSSFFKIGCIHTSQSEKQREAVLENAKSGKLHAIIVSPEAIVSGDSKTFGNIFKQIPPIAFACIDEVHCLSQWSHNFRPSYLMISRVLKEKFGIRTILGLTATATVSTIKCIVKELGISDDQGVIQDIRLPDNLYLSVSKDENKEEALLSLLQSQKFSNFNSILIYCTRRDDCERLAAFIRTSLQNSDQKQCTNQRLSCKAEAYHAGMTASRRKQIQNAFMKGNLRIVVATVAFGMGINKQDIRAVIHFNMPKDFECYVQEIGRAGRDGMPAHCHVFLDSEGRDLNELRRHIYSNSVDRHILRKILQKVFMECDCSKENKPCQGHEIAFSLDETVNTLDIPEENIHTLLYYLELHEKKFIKVLAPAYINCKIKSYKGIKEIHAAAQTCAPLAYISARNNCPNKKKSNVLEFNVIKIADKIRWDSSLVKSELRKLEWEISSKLTWVRTGISVEFSDLGFRVISRGDMSPSELDEALDYLVQRTENQEKRSSSQLDIIFSSLDHFSYKRYIEALKTDDEGRSENLKSIIKNYFLTEELDKSIQLKNLQMVNFEENVVAADVRALICTYPENTFNARAVARIFHGIQSPNYLASVWFKCRFWRKHLDKDFNKIISVAKQEILRLKF